MADSKIKGEIVLFHRFGEIRKSEYLLEDKDIMDSMDWPGYKAIMDLIHEDWKAGKNSGETNHPYYNQWEMTQAMTTDCSVHLVFDLNHSM